MTNKQELLKKLKALAEAGIGGEKINAQKKLDELIKKYNISEEDLTDDILIDCEFTYHGKTEKRLLNQIIYKVTNERNNSYGFVYTYSERICRTKRGCRATKAQKIEIEFLFDFYKKLYKKEEELFLIAFIQKHELFGELKDGEQPQERSEEEILKLGLFASGMSDETPLKQIPEKI